LFAKPAAGKQVGGDGGECAGYGRADANSQRSWPKPFYKEGRKVDEGGFTAVCILL
jgi:hypothetical protein